MAHKTGTSPAAVSYAQALLELAGELPRAEELAGELDAVGQLLKSEPLFQTFLQDPAISSGDRWNLLKNTFEGRASELLVNFLGVLNEKGRIGIVSQIIQAYHELLDVKANRVQVEVTVARALDEQQLSDVRNRVSTVLGKTAIIEQKVDDSIIGGLVLRVQDQVMDASVKAQLDTMRKQLLASRVA